MPNIFSNTSPYEVGQNDSYYYRYNGKPRKYIKLTPVYDLTPEEIADYHRGFNDNEAEGFKKDWR